MKKEAVFWDVDTQYDLMRPEGRLYVAGAEGIIDTVSEARRFALENGYSIIAATDWHREGNEEISNKPDFIHSFPAHCMAGKPGSERVGYLGELPIGIVPNERMNDSDLQKLVEKEQFHIVIRKEEFDVFSNPNTATIVEFLKPKKAVVFGVALDLCVRQVVERLSERGDIKLYLLRDAVKALGLRGEDEVMDELRTKGVEIISVADLEKKF
ncbi:MAG: isochorismatase family protein [Sedimentisphaerales bacterium]|nr:isochorismatase family protein [Sedimentisphaerales bacterium]